MVNATVNENDGGRIASMTGYATADGTVPGVRWTWEIRGVNARGLDLRIRLPDGLGALEQGLRKSLSGRLARGSVTMNLRLARDETATAWAIDPAALEGALASLRCIREAAAMQGLETTWASAAEILNLRGVLDSAASPEAPEPEVLLADAETAIDAFVAMRHAEGAELRDLLSDQVDRIDALTTAAEAAAASRAETQAASFRDKVAKLVEVSDLDPARLAQEVAILAVKSDVTEEIDRLRAHVAGARALLDQGGPVGRKLDFLMQEFNREANTLCSKSGDAALTAIGLDLKLAIDQTREQVQNVE